MKIIRYNKWTLLLLCMLSLMSCRHKDLYMEQSMTSHLMVRFDWRDAPDATPSSMAMYLYENDGSSPMRYIFDNRYGGLIRAPFGTRHAICMSADNTDWVHLRNHENIETFEIYTGDSPILSDGNVRADGVPRPSGTENERLSDTPRMIWGSRLNNILVKPHEGTDTITLYPHEAICRYTVDIYDVDNLGGVGATTIPASLSGMAEGYNFGADSSTDTQVSMTFTLSAMPATDSLHGEFLTFGESPAYGDKHYLAVYVTLSDGSRWWQSFDVTDQVSKAPDPRNVHIIIHGLPLPEPPQEGGAGLIPDVNEWQVINVDLQM